MPNQHTYKSDIDRIISRVSINKETSCWEWTGTRNGPGYGAVSYMGKMVQAHRLSYEKMSLPNTDVVIPEGMVVMHDCDNPCCVNPTHLRVGSHADNMADMTAKGRRIGTLAGEKNGMSKLTERDVIDMRNMYTAGGWTTYTLADGFGINQALAWRIIRGKAWNHIKEGGNA